MLWNGYSVYTTWGYQPVTKPAIIWTQKADGNWAGYDRGVAEDVFEANVIFNGPSSELTELETLLNDGRETFTVTCGDGEEIFGADIDYSSALTVAVMDHGTIERLSFGMYSLALTLRLISTIAYLGSASLATLRLGSFNYQTGSQFDTVTHPYYDRTVAVIDGSRDPGVFRASFSQTTAEAKAIRRYLLTTGRTGAVAFPSIGVSYPWGTRMSSGGNCKIIAWQDRGRMNLQDWQFEITFARVRT